jgi:hypothetical protein
MSVQASGIGVKCPQMCVGACFLKFEVIVRRPQAQLRFFFDFDPQSEQSQKPRKLSPSGPDFLQVCLNQGL